MVSAIATSPAIDLSGLPPPVIIPQPDFETRFQAKLAQLIELLSSFNALVESDPAYKLLQADSYDEMVLVQAFVDASRQNLIAFATGSNLEHLGAFYGVQRLVVTPADPEAGEPAVMETDSDLRERIVLAPHSFSVAGPASAYVYFARSASGQIRDASATSPSPGVVIVSVLGREGNGEADADLLELVEEALDDDVRPLTDMVTIQSADIVEFEIEADLWLYAGPDPELILQSSRDSLDAMLEKQRRLGRDITRSAIIAALHVSGVQNVNLIAPGADQVMTQLQAGFVTDIALTNVGVAE